MAGELNQVDAGPVLLCFDGSDDAAAAIARAGRILGRRQAVVLTVDEPLPAWEPYDPATILTAPVSKLATHALGLDAIADTVAHDTVNRGVALAGEAGFEAEGRVTEGKPWRVICEIADELEAEPIVLGARGLSRVETALLGSVSAAVVRHARRPVLVVPRHAESENPTRSE
jgi:nucleotide-binding universal stress UspA family protein